jgi:hypothetical protein
VFVLLVLLVIMGGKEVLLQKGDGKPMKYTFSYIYFIYLPSSPASFIFVKPVIYCFQEVVDACFACPFGYSGRYSSRTDRSQRPYLGLLLSSSFAVFLEPSLPGLSTAETNTTKTRQTTYL